MTWRRVPGSEDVQASVARTTWRARTVPRVVVTSPGRTAVARVLSWTRTPSRLTASARPRTRAAGCTRAHHGVHVPPRTRLAASRPVASAASSSSTPSMPPYAWSTWCSVRARLSWAALRASTTVPPRVQPQSMPSSATTRPTSSTVRFIACRIASACARPWRCSSALTEAGNSAEHQPPFRPLAPNPAMCDSTTTTRRSGRARAR
jgi:hypothetical protein